MCAIKKVDLSEVSEPEAEAFRNEVKLLQKLQGNKRIIKLFDFEERVKPNKDGKELLVVMERGERDLANLLKDMSKDQELTDTKIKFYWEEMLETVAVVHQQNIVHSDLKPANFLIVNGTLKIIDFGIASKISDDKTHVTKDNTSAWSGLQFFGLGRASVQTIGLGPSRAFNDFNFFGLGLFGLCLERAFGLKLLNIFLKIMTFFNFYFSKIEAFDKSGCSMH